ncbi:alpha/beta hydrolase family protein [Anaerosolibacter sp.]|uniref:alpha/beta hydrolase family protein n=1 Tax=Anaerosolibacter sp. TaxID=1872527 RepID=UPI0039F10160
MKYTFVEKDIIISGEYPLVGTITIPKLEDRLVPGILMIPGMGKVDRDENFKFLPMNILKGLSDALAEEGFITLRYDKRGVGRSGGNFYRASLWDLVEDAKAALELLKSHPYVDKRRIIVLGHSEGTIIAAALYRRKPVDGMILLCGLAHGMEEVIERRKNRILQDLEHIKGIKGKLLQLFKTKKILNCQYKKMKRKIMKDRGSVIRIKGKRINGQWLREHFRYNVMKDLRKIECPTLILGGSADVQAVPSQVQETARAIKGPVESHVIQNLNHILRKDSSVSSVLGGVLDYWIQVEQPIDPEVIQIITRWLKRFKVEK